MRARTYNRSRQAYEPGLWPQALVSLAIWLPLAHWLSWPLYVEAPLGWGIGSAVGTVRWWLWCRRHPRLTAEQFCKVQSFWAPYN